MEDRECEAVKGRLQNNELKKWIEEESFRTPEHKWRQHRIKWKTNKLQRKPSTMLRTEYYDLNAALLQSHTITYDFSY